MWAASFDALAAPGWCRRAHPVGRPVLYPTQHEPDGAVVAIRPTAEHRCPTGGAVPCHLTHAPDGTWIHVANYGAGTITATAPDDGGDLTTDAVRLEFTGSSVASVAAEVAAPMCLLVEPGAPAGP